MKGKRFSFAFTRRIIWQFVKVGKGKFLRLTEAAEGYFWHVVYIINGIFLGTPSFSFDLASCSTLPFKKMNLTFISLNLIVNPTTTAGTLLQFAYFFFAPPTFVLLFSEIFQQNFLLAFASHKQLKVVR